jgi:hypothetical protein
MRKTLTAAMAALTLGGAISTAAAPAEARDWGHHGGYGGHYYGGGRYYGRGNGGAAIAAGVVGLALGAALADSGPRYYSGGYYAPPPPPYGYGYGYRTCESTRWVWDPYYRHQVPVTTRYAC